MIDFAGDTAKIAVSLALLLATLAVTARAVCAGILAPEHGRKSVHVGLGLYCLVFPFIFDQASSVAIACVLALGVFALARGRMRRALGAGLHSVARQSHGEAYFALAVGGLFLLREGAPAALGEAAYIAPLAILTISDAAAALVGQRFGRHSFAIAGGLKSWEGVGAFALTAALIAQLSLTLLSALAPAEIALLSLTVAVVCAGSEALSARGLDNLMIPASAYAVLAGVTRGGFDWALALALLGAGAALLAALAARGQARPRR